MRRFDLNLLYTLRELLKEPNTTRVAEKLGLTQSAVSASLNRLRWAFQDELFVRSGRTMKPTRRAETLLQPVDEILNLIEKIVEEVPLEPQKMERTFRLSSAEFVFANMVPALLKKIQRDAPLVTVRCEIASADTFARMRSGHIDLAIAPLETWEDDLSLLSHQPLYSDRLVCLASENNKLLGDELTADKYLSSPHVIYWTSQNKPGAISAAERAIRNLGLKLNIACEVTSFSLVASALENTNLIATVPSRILDKLPEKKSLKVYELPFDVEPFTVNMVWNRSFDADAEHKWFRAVIEDQYRSSSE